MATGVMLTDHLAQMVSVCVQVCACVCVCVEAVVRGGNTTGGPSSVYWQL